MVSRDHQISSKRPLTESLRGNYEGISQGSQFWIQVSVCFLVSETDILNAFFLNSKIPVVKHFAK